MNRALKQPKPKRTQVKPPHISNEAMITGDNGGWNSFAGLTPVDETSELLINDGTGNTSLGGTPRSKKSSTNGSITYVAKARNNVLENKEPVLTPPEKLTPLSLNAKIVDQRWKSISLPKRSDYFIPKGQQEVLSHEGVCLFPPLQPGRSAPKAHLPSSDLERFTKQVENDHQNDNSTVIHSPNQENSAPSFNTESVDQGYPAPSSTKPALPDQESLLPSSVDSEEISDDSDESPEIYCSSGGWPSSPTESIQKDKLPPDSSPPQPSSHIEYQREPTSTLPQQQEEYMDSSSYQDHEHRIGDDMVDHKICRESKEDTNTEALDDSNVISASISEDKRSCDEIDKDDKASARLNRDLFEEGRVLQEEKDTHGPLSDNEKVDLQSFDADSMQSREEVLKGYKDSVHEEQDDGYLLSGGNDGKDGDQDEAEVLDSKIEQPSPPKITPSSDHVTDDDSEMELEMPDALGTQVKVAKYDHHLLPISGNAQAKPSVVQIHRTPYAASNTRSVKAIQDDQEKYSVPCTFEDKTPVDSKVRTKRKAEDDRVSGPAKKKLRHPQIREQVFAGKRVNEDPSVEARLSHEEVFLQLKKDHEDKTKEKPTIEPLEAKISVVDQVQERRDKKRPATEATRTPLADLGTKNGISNVPIASQVMNKTSTEDVYATFQNAYPDYQGSREHFVNMCTKIQTLNMANRMEHRSLWDDFIVRHTLEYAEHLSRCARGADDPIPYSRYYRNEIEHPIYTKRILTPVNIGKVITVTGPKPNSTSRAHVPAPSLKSTNKGPSSSTLVAAKPVVTTNRSNDPFKCYTTPQSTKDRGK